MAKLRKDEVVTLQVLHEKGESKRAIARQLNVSEGTVRYHLRRQASSQHASQLDWIAAAWPQLQPHVRDAILTLIDGAINALEREESMPQD